MNNLEKIIFLRITWRQFGKLDDKEYYATYSLLSQEEKKLIGRLDSEIHDIYSYINTNFKEKILVDSIQEYNDRIKSVSEIILNVSNDFSLSLKAEITEEFKSAIIKMFGKDYLDNFLDKTNY